MRLRCPFPGCVHVGEAITKVHCKLVHNMDRKELYEKYGEPIKEKYDPHKLSKNSQKTNSLIGNHVNYERTKGRSE